MMTKGLTYLASPYSAPTAKQRKQRFKQVCRKAAALMLNGEEIFCPIAHSHPIEVEGMDEIKDGEFWLKQDFAVLEHCKHMYVYCMPGWEQSKGIKREIEFAEMKNIPVTYIT
jgi:hypothetical protein